MHGSFTRLLPIVLLCVFLGCRSEAPDPKKLETAITFEPGDHGELAIVKLNARTAEFAGHQHHLVAIRHNGVLMIATDEKEGVLFVNRQSSWKALRFAEKDDQIEPDLNNDFFIGWMHLPANEKIELWSGTLSSKQLAATGGDFKKNVPQDAYRPFTIAVEQIPTVRATTIDALKREVGILFPRRNP